MSKNRTSRFIPIIIAVSIVAGILIGTFYANHFSGNRLGIINTSSNKLNALLRIIDDQYVDTVKMNELVEDAMPQILGELDPHSSYIPAKDLEAVNSDLKGSFSGIGIQFTIQQDTIHILISLFSYCCFKSSQWEFFFLCDIIHFKRRTIYEQKYRIIDLISNRSYLLIYICL